MLRFIFLCFILSPCSLLAMDLANLFAPPGKAKNAVSYNGTSYPGSINNEEFSFSVPVYQDETDSWQLLGKTRLLLVDTIGVLPDSGVRVPRQFWDVGAGINYLHRYENESTLSFLLNVGSASDQPFTSYDVTTLDATIFYGFKTSEVSRWLLLLNYSNNRSLLNNIPIPGVAYLYTPSKTFRGIFGIPFASLYWMPFDKAGVSFFILAPRFIRAELNYMVWGPIQVFTGFEYYQTLYLRRDRDVSANRFYYDDKRVLFGVRSFLSRELRISLNGGYGFDREFFEGDRFNHPTSGVLPVGAAWFIQWGINASF